MAAGRIVEAFDELEDGDTGLAMRSEAATIDEFPLEGREELSHIALSQASPTEPVDARTPASLERAPKATDTGSRRA